MHTDSTLLFPNLTAIFNLRRILFYTTLLYFALIALSNAGETSEFDYAGFQSGPVELGWSYKWAKEHKVLHIRPYPGYKAGD